MCVCLWLRKSSPSPSLSLLLWDCRLPLWTQHKQLRVCAIEGPSRSPCPDCVPAKTGTGPVLSLSTQRFVQGLAQGRCSAHRVAAVMTVVTVMMMREKELERQLLEPEEPQPGSRQPAPSALPASWLRRLPISPREAQPP